MKGKFNEMLEKNVKLISSYDWEPFKIELLKLIEEEIVKLKKTISIERENIVDLQINNTQTLKEVNEAIKNLIFEQENL